MFYGRFVARFSARLAILAPLAAIILISIIWMLREGSTSSVPQPSVTMIEPGIDGSGAGFAPDAVPAPGPTDSTPTAPVGVEPATPEGVQPTPPPAEAAAAPAADPNVNPALVAGTPAEVAPAPTPAVPKPVGTQLVLEFGEISWARVEDASGKSLLSGVISPGDTQTLDGKPPYSVFLGNAPGVKVSFGGVPVDLKPFVKGNSTARFSVPSAGGN